MQKLTLWIQFVVLLALGALCLHFHFLTEVRPDGSAHEVIKNYLSPPFQLATLIGGIAFIVLGTFLILTHQVQAGCGHDHDDDCGHDHHEHGDIPAFIAVVVIGSPIIFSVTNTKHRFSIRELDRRTEVEINPEALQGAIYTPPSFSRDNLDRYLKKNENGIYKIGLFELFTTVNDKDVTTAIEGLNIEVQAAVRNMPGAEHDPKLKRAYRLMMQCCAADMQALTMKLQLTDEMAQNFDYPEHTWLKMEAKLNYEIDDKGSKRAVLTAYSAEETPRPEDEIMLADFKPPSKADKQEHQYHNYQAE